MSCLAALGAVPLDMDICCRQPSMSTTSHHSASHATRRLMLLADFAIVR